MSVVGDAPPRRRSLVGSGPDAAPRRRRSSALPSALTPQPALYALVAAKNKMKVKKPTIVKLLDSMEFNFVQQLEQNVVVYTLHSALIILSVVTFVAETSPEFGGVQTKIYAELFFALIFTIEVFLRYLGHLQNNSPFWTDPLIWVDILSIAPIVVVGVMCEGQPWLETCTEPRELWYIQVLLAFKILRVFKISRHFSGTKILLHTFRQSMVALQAPLVFLFVSVTLFASLMYFLESGKWNDEAEAYLFPDGSSPSFSSVLDTAYFVCVTMTTVGYGDQSPVSSSGKALAIMMMLFGVLFTAMPLTIIGNEFYDAMEKEGDFQYLLDAEKMEQRRSDVRPEIITFERVSHEFVLVGAATTRLHRYLERVQHDPSNPTETDFECEKHVLVLLREWIQRHVKFMYTIRVLTTPDYHDKAKYAAWKKRVGILGFNRSFRTSSTPTAQPSGAATSESAKVGVAPLEDGGSGPVAVGESRKRRSARGWRHKLYLFLDEPDSSRAASLWSNFIFVLIVVSIMAFTLENQFEVDDGVPPSAERMKLFFFLDAVINSIFTVELLLRIMVTKSIRRFCFNMYNIFDFLAILPFYATFFGFDSILMRLVRMLRIFKLSSRIEGTQVVVKALKASLRSLLIPVYMLIVITLVFGAALWLAESGTKVTEPNGDTGNIMGDGTGTDVTGILRAGWVIIVTMTTVGYGDITPSTLGGRVTCVIAMLFGILYMAMPIAIVGNNFWKAYEAHMKAKRAQENIVSQEVVQLPPQQQITFELACDAGKKLARTVAMMDRRIRKLRKVFDDPEQPPPSTAILAARMLDLMAEGESAVHKAIMARTAKPPHVKLGPGAAKKEEEEDDAGVDGAGSDGEGGGATPLGLPRMPFAPAKSDALPPIAGGAKLVAKSRMLLSAGGESKLSPSAGAEAESKGTDELLSHAHAFAPGKPQRRQLSYAAANTTAGVGLVRVVAQSYLDQLLSVSEVLSYLHEAIELREMKRTVVQRISLDTARKAEQMFQRVITRQKRKTAMKRMAQAMHRQPQAYVAVP